MVDIEPRSRKPWQFSLRSLLLFAQGVNLFFWAATAFGAVGTVIFALLAGLAVTGEQNASPLHRIDYQ